MQGRRWLFLAPAALAIGLTGLAIFAWPSDGAPSASDLVASAAAQEIKPSPGDVVLIEKEYNHAAPDDSLKDPYHLDPALLVPPKLRSVAYLRLGDDGVVIERDLRLFTPEGELLQHEYSLGTREMVFNAIQNQIETYTLPRPITFDQPIDITALAEEDGIESAGEERFGGETVQLLEFRALSEDGRESVWQYGVRASDGMMVLRRQLAVLPDGSTETVDETRLLKVEVNPTSAPVVAFEPPKSRVPTFDLDNEVSFNLPPEEQVSEEVARSEAKSTFLSVDPEMAKTSTVYRSSGAPLPWDDLTLSQRHLQYATGISSAYRTVGSVNTGGSFQLIQAPVTELGRILQSTPALWDRSYPRTTDTEADGSKVVWVGVSAENGVFAITPMFDTLVVVATDAGEDAALALIATLRK